MQSRAGDYFTIVIEDAQGVPVASGTILVERKFIRGCGLVGHIEDIVVDAGQRGKNLGRKIIDQLTHIGKLAGMKMERERSVAFVIVKDDAHLPALTGCYKVILCCDEKNVGFYEKCGYAKKEVEMALYF